MNLVEPRWKEVVRCALGRFRRLALILWSLWSGPPPRRGPAKCWLRVRAISLNFRDLLMVKGLYNPKMQLPRIPCSDGAGEVVEVGAVVTAWKPGDRVAGIFMQNWLDGPLTAARAKGALGGDIDGMLADYVVLKEDGLVAIPDHLSFQEAATLPCAAVTAWNALGGRRCQAGLDGADSGNRRCVDFCAAVCAAARRARDRHFVEQ